MWVLLLTTAVFTVHLACLNALATVEDATKLCDQFLANQRPVNEVLNLDSVETMNSAKTTESDSLLKSLFFCHPRIASSYLRCVLTSSTDGKLVKVETGETVSCQPGTFFNSDIKACVFERHSNCAAGQGKSSTSTRENDREWKICNKYLQTLPSAYTGSLKSHLICDDVSGSEFIVCSLNANSAHRFSCLDGMFFNQARGKCVKNAAESDCVLREEEETRLQAAMMTAILPVHRCLCHTTLSKTNQEVVYVADSTLSTRFLICINGGPIYINSCPASLHWNEKKAGCDATPYRRPLHNCDGGSGRRPGHDHTTNNDVSGGGNNGDRSSYHGSAGRGGGYQDPELKPTKFSPTSQKGSKVEISVSLKDRCICDAALKDCAKGETAYRCDPNNECKFLVCRNGRIFRQSCPTGLFWNSQQQACTSQRHCLPIPETCAARTASDGITAAPTTTTAATTTSTTTTTTTTTTPRPCTMRYTLHTKKLDWHTARLVCEANLMELAVILNNDTQNYLTKIYGSDKKKSYGGIWIGASDGGEEGTWRWVTGPLVNYTNWYPGQPSGYKYQHCMQFNYYRVKGAWDDTRCYYKKTFLCQQEDCSPVIPLPLV